MNETVQLVSGIVNLVTSTAIQVIAIYVLISLLKALKRTLKEWTHSSS